MPTKTNSHGQPPFNDYIVPGILLLIAAFCLYKSIVNIHGVLGINGHWAMSALALVACAILSRINTHLRFLIWLNGGENAIDVWNKAAQALERQLDQKLHSFNDDFIEAQEERTARQNREQEQRLQEQEQRIQAEILKKDRAVRAARALTQDDTLTPDDEVLLQNSTLSNTPAAPDDHTPPRQPLAPRTSLLNTCNN